jgi:hypothetical protein
VLLLVLCGSVGARAEEVFDGKQPLLCVSSEAYDCSGEADCVETSPEGLSVPDSMAVDPAAKTLRALDDATTGLIVFGECTGS